MNPEPKLSWNLQGIAQAVQGSVWVRQGSSATQSVSEWVYDTRRCTHPERGLFLALSGTNSGRDGHHFLDEAYRLGIRNFLVKEGHVDSWPPEDLTVSVLAVPDPLKALQELAAIHRHRWGGDVWAITGSNGKTQVKEWMAEMLQGQTRFCKTPGSFNSQLGLPLSVLGATRDCRLGVFEAGISQEGEMKALARILRPQGGLLTHFGEAHQEGFLSTAHKLKEKLSLFEGCTWVVARADLEEEHQKVWRDLVLRNPQTGFHWWIPEAASERLASWFEELVKEGASRKQLHSWKLLAQPDQAKNPNRHELCCEGKTPVVFDVPRSGEAVLENMVGTVLALAIGGYWSNEWAPRCAELRTLSMRMEIKEIPGSCRLLNDSYSLDLDSFQWALREWALQVGDSEGIVVLSEPDTREQTPLEPFLQTLQRYPWKRLYLVGPRWKEQAWAPHPHQAVDFFEDTNQLLQQWPLGQSAHACILLKGARKFGFERIEQKLLVQGHQTVLEIDLEAVRHNFGIFRSLVSPGVRMMVMVKAGAYGSGSVEIARALQEAGVDYLAVASAGEGIELRRGGVHSPVLVMNCGPTSTDTVLQYGLEPDLYALDEIRRWTRALREPAFFHLPLDTGMRRLGLGMEDREEALNLLSQSAQNIRIRSIYTHLTSSEEPAQDSFSAGQWQSLQDFVGAFEKRMGYRPLVHALNTAGIVRFPDYQADMVRLGLGLYGLDSTNMLQERLKPLAKFKTILVQTHQLKRGQTLGYGNQGVMNQDGVVGVLPVGYADGLTRSLGMGKVSFLINGSWAPTIGRISMDFCLVDLTDIPAHVGDEVVLWSNTRDVRAWAEASGTIPYEILTGLSPRVQRVYIRG